MRSLLWIPLDSIVGGLGYAICRWRRMSFWLTIDGADGSLMRSDFCLLACVLLGWAIRDGYCIIRYSDRRL